MELEQMKTLWEEMSVELEKQKKLTDSLIIKMTQVNYRNKLSKILIPEAMGSLLCFIAALFVFINFQKLNTWYLMVCGVIVLLILLLSPILSLNAIYKINSVNILKNNYKQSLLEYTKAKKQFWFGQKLSFYLAAMLLLVALPVMGRLIGGKDLFKETRLFYLYIIAFPFGYAFAYLTFKSYKRTIADAEEILKELEG